MVGVNWKIVDGDAVLGNISHHRIFEFAHFRLCQRVGFGNYGYNVAAVAQTLHKLNIELAERMPSRRDKVQDGVDTVVWIRRANLGISGCA